MGRRTRPRRAGNARVLRTVSAVTPSPANLDWLYHALGWTLAAGSGLLLVWALLWDRARGRRRCPACWYDMNGVSGLRCPECGRVAASAGKLQRTRRRWRWTPVAAALALGGYLT